MSVNVYFQDEVQKKDGFIVTNYTHKGKQLDEYSLPGLQLYRDKGRFYFFFSELDNPIPTIVEDVVEDISFYDRIPCNPERIIGVYKYKSAEAELDRSGERVTYGLKIHGKNMEDIRELYRQIRAGTITPEESWDEGVVQGVDKTSVLVQEISELRKEFDELDQVLHKTTEENNELREKSKARMVAVRSFRSAHCLPWWRFLKRRKRIKEAMTASLDLITNA